MEIKELNQTLTDSKEFYNILIKPILERLISLPKVIEKMKLNAKEKEILQQNKIESIKGSLCIITALQIIGNGDESDAIRHTYLSACLVNFTDVNFAKDLMSAHESISKDPMDLHNNNIGFEIGLNANTHDLLELYNLSLNALNKGKLQVKNPKVKSKNNPTKMDNSDHPGHDKRDVIRERAERDREQRDREQRDREQRDREQRDREQRDREQRDREQRDRERRDREQRDREQRDRNQRDLIAKNDHKKPS